MIVPDKVRPEYFANLIAHNRSILGARQDEYAHQHLKERHGKAEQVDQFRIYGNQELGSAAMGETFWSAVRDPHNLY